MEEDCNTCGDTGRWETTLEEGYCPSGLRSYPIDLVSPRGGKNEQTTRRRKEGRDDVLLLILDVNEEEGYEWCNVMYYTTMSIWLPLMSLCLQPRHHSPCCRTVSRLNDGLYRLISTALVT